MTPVVKVYVSGPAFWQTLLAVLLGAAVGAAGSIYGSLLATRRHLKTAAAQEGLLWLLNVVAPLHTIVTVILPSKKPQSGEPFQSIFWVRTRSQVATVVKAWMEAIAFRIRSQKVRDAFERFAEAWAKTDAAGPPENVDHSYVQAAAPSNPTDEFWAAVDELGKAVDNLRDAAQAALDQL